MAGIGYLFGDIAQNVMERHLIIMTVKYVIHFTIFTAIQNLFIKRKRYGGEDSRI